jgi:serine/threonine protein kinase HipA of HipAB toxin-antitoxin module
MTKTKNPWTAAELRRFDQLTEATSSPNGHTRVIARLDLKKFVEEVGKDKCDAMYAHLIARDKKRGRP